MANEKLTDMIDELVTSKTFSLDAIDVIKKLKDRAAALENQLTTRDATIVELREFKETAQTTIAEQRAVIMGIEARENSCTEREGKLHQVEMERAVAQAKASTFEQAMKIVFAPNMVRNSVQAYGGGSRPDGSYSNTNENRTQTVVDGYARPGDTDSGVGVSPNTTL